MNIERSQNDLGSGSNPREVKKLSPIFTIASGLCAVSVSLPMLVAMRGAKHADFSGTDLTGEVRDALEA